MADYSKTTNFTALDATNAVITGARYDTEFDNIATAVSSKAENATAETITGAWTFSEDITMSKDTIFKVGSDVASATNMTLGDGVYFDITGTTAIESIATKGPGARVVLHFDAALTLTHHATNLILPGAANITTVAGDIAEFYEYATADWRCVSYTRAGGLGTGAKSLTANSALLGNGTSDVQLVAPGSSGNVLTSNGSTWASAAAAGGGKVLQVVTGTTTTQVDLNSTTLTDTGLTADITPSASGSKVFILVSQAVANNGRSEGRMVFLRGSTNIYDTIGVGDVNDMRVHHFHTFLDSPSTTSATTYKMQMSRYEQSGTLMLQEASSGSSAKSTIVLVEIGA